MSETPKVRDRRSVWVYGTSDVVGMTASPHEVLHEVRGEPLVLYCVSPRLIPHAALGNERLAAIVCPTPSPFSHDANLMRTLAADRGILAVCGLDLGQYDQTPVRIAISPSKSLIEVDGEKIAVTKTLSGSDEALGCLVSRSAVCYRPMYLYDDWLGQRIARGLQEGVGRLTAGATARAVADTNGRVWLENGPLPEGIAEWILHHPRQYISMLIELTDALGMLTSDQWSQDGILDDPAFLAAFDVNCLVAPFVGFPLFSLTQKCVDRAAPGSSGRDALESRVSDVSRLIPTSDRKNGVLSSSALAATVAFLQSIETPETADVGLELAVASILLSDVRRIVIDRLRRSYTMFKMHTRHRALT